MLRVCIGHQVELQIIKWTDTSLASDDRSACGFCKDLLLSMTESSTVYWLPGYICREIMPIRPYSDFWCHHVCTAWWQSDRGERKAISTCLAPSVTFGHFAPRPLSKLRSGCEESLPDITGIVLLFLAHRLR